MARRSVSSVRYSWETEVLGSAGGPARAVPLLESDRFLIVNGDTLTDVDLRAVTTQHVDTNAMVTMAVVDADPRYNGDPRRRRRESCTGFQTRPRNHLGTKPLGVSISSAYRR